MTTTEETTRYHSRAWAALSGRAQVSHTYPASPTLMDQRIADLMKERNIDQKTAERVARIQDERAEWDRFHWENDPLIGD